MKYIVFGTDTYRSREFIRQINPEIEVIDEVNQIKSVLLKLNQQGLFGEARLVVFKNLYAHLRDKLPTLLDSVLEWVVWEETDRLSIPADLRKQLKVVEFKPLKPYQVRKWVQDKAKELKLQIEAAALDELVRLHGNNLFLLENELIKLATYALSKKEALSLDEVRHLSIRSEENSILRMLDVIGERTKPKQGDNLAILADQRVDEWYLFSMLVRHIRQILQAKVGIQLKVHPYVAKKIRQQADQWQEGELTQALSDLLEIEFKAKTGKVKLRPALVSWIFRVPLRHEL